MTRMMLGRLALAVPSLFAVSVLVFLATQALPGDAAVAALGRNATPQGLESFRERFNLDAPLVSQYLTWLVLLVPLVAEICRTIDPAGKRIVIAPPQRAERGTATLAGIVSYAGKPFKWLSGGAWTDAYGWQELRRAEFAELRPRWSAACDVPDLALLPARFPGVQTVEFRAALKIGRAHV